MDWGIAAVALLIGFVVGLTGMGGGALMTPVLVIFFNVKALSAVSSDLLASLIMKPVGSAVHARRGTIQWGLVRWLMAGSIPSAFCGVLVIKAVGSGNTVQHAVKLALGIALLIASAAIVTKAYIELRQHAPLNAPVSDLEPHVDVKPIPTLLIGIVGGFVVGMTSVGSGSLIIVSLLLLYPGLRAAQLVGTDLVQAIPLVGAAVAGHLIFGDVKLGLTSSLVVGGIPGVYLGAHASARAPHRLIRRALLFVLLASALKLLNVPNLWLGVALLAALVLGPLAWTFVRRLVMRPEPGEPPRAQRVDLSDVERR